MNDIKHESNTDEGKKERPLPPGAPDRTAVEDPPPSEVPPMGDPQSPNKKKPRLKTD